MKMVEFSANRIEPKRLRCVTLVRVSTAEQAEDGRAGVPRQRAVIASVVAAKNYQVIDAIELIDVSGSMIQHTPEIAGLIRRIEAAEVDVILTSEMSRLARPNDWEDMQLLDACKRYRVLIDLGGSILDLDSPEGYLNSGILAILGGHERLMIRKRMMASKEQRRAAGKNPGSNITLPLGIGYDRKQDCYLHDGDIAKVIEAFRLMDEEGIRNITEIGRRSGIHVGNVRHILRNPIYKGWRVYDKERDLTQKVAKADGRQGDRRKVRRPDEKVIKVRVFPADQQAVADDRWERVQVILSGIRENHSTIVAGRYQGCLLGGVGRCGFCGQRLYGKRRSRRLANGSQVSGHYICRSHHETATRQPHNVRCAQGWNRKEEMDELMEAFVQRFFNDEEFVRSVLDQARRKQASKVIGIDVSETLRGKLSELEKKEKRLLDAVEEGVLTAKEAKQRRDRLVEERERVLASLRTHEVQENVEEELTGIAGRLQNRAEGWPANGTTREKKQALQLLFSEVYFRGTRISAFRLAPELVGEGGGAWKFATKMPIALDPMVSLRDEPEPIPVPEGHRRCTQCKTVKIREDFYRNCSECKVCKNAKNAAWQRLRRRKSAHNVTAA